MSDNLYYELTKATNQITSDDLEQRKSYVENPDSYGMFLTLEQKTKAVQEKLEDKQKGFEGYSTGTLQSIVDGDSLVIQNENGQNVLGRLTSDIDPYLDTVETDHANSKGTITKASDIVKNSFYKSKNQPGLVSDLTGKPKTDLTNTDYNAIGVEHRKKLEELLGYNPNNPEKKVYYKVQGQDQYGRPLLDIINPETRKNVGTWMATDAKANANFDYKAFSDELKKLNPAEVEEDLTPYASKIMQDYRQIAFGSIQDTDGRFGENVDLMQSSGIQTLSNMAEAFVRLISMQEDQLKNNKGTQYYYSSGLGIDPAVGKDQRTPEQKQIDYVKEFKDNKNKTDAVVKAITGYSLDDLQDSEITDAVAGVSKATRADFMYQTEKAKKLITTGNPLNVMKGLGIIAINADRFIAESAPATLSLAAPGGSGIALYTLGQVNEIANSYKENTGKEMSPEDMTKAFLTRLPVTVIEDILFKGITKTALGKKSILSRFTNPGVKGLRGILKNSGKAIGASGAMEYLQETLEGVHTEYFATAQDKRDLIGALTNFDNHFGGIVGSITAGMLTGGAKLTGNITKDLPKLSKSSLKKLYAKRAAEVTVTGEKPDTDVDTRVKADISAGSLAEIDKAQPEDVIKEYVRLQQENLENISAISLTTNSMIAKRMSALKAKVIQDGTSEDIDALYAEYTTEEEKLEAKKKDLEQIVYHSTPDMRKITEEDKTTYNKLGKNLGLDPETTRKSYTQVGYESKYGIIGYETFKTVLGNLQKYKRKLETQEQSVPVQDHLKKTDIEIDHVKGRLDYFLNSQVKKLSVFTNGIEELIIDKEKRTFAPNAKISYKRDTYHTHEENTKGTFNIRTKNIQYDSFEKPAGVYKVLEGIVDNIEGIINALEQTGFEVDSTQKQEFIKTVDILDTAIAAIKPTNASPTSLKNKLTLNFNASSKSTNSNSNSNSNSNTNSDSNSDSKTDATADETISVKETAESAKPTELKFSTTEKTNKIPEEDKSTLTGSKQGSEIYKTSSKEGGKTSSKEDSKEDSKKLDNISDSSSETLNKNKDNERATKNKTEATFSSSKQATKATSEASEQVSADTDKATEQTSEKAPQNTGNAEKISEQKPEGPPVFGTLSRNSYDELMGYAEEENKKAQKVLKRIKEVRELIKKRINGQKTNTFEDTTDTKQDRKKLAKLLLIQRKIQGKIKKRVASNIREKYDAGTLTVMNSILSFKRPVSRGLSEEVSLIPTIKLQNKTGNSEHYMAKGLTVSNLLRFNSNKASLLSAVPVVNVTKKMQKFMGIVKPENQYAANDAQEDPARALLFNNNGKFNHNVVMAITTVAQDMIYNNGKMFDPRSDSEIASTLGKDKNEITSKDRHFVHTNGVFLNHIADTLGKQILGLLGLEYNNDLDPETIEPYKNAKGEVLTINGKKVPIDTYGHYKRLVSHAGNHAIQFLNKEGYIELRKTPKNLVKGIIPLTRADGTIQTAKLVKSVHDNITDKQKKVFNEAYEKLTLEKDYARKPKPFKTNSKEIKNKFVRNSMKLFKPSKYIQQRLKERRNTKFTADLPMIDFVLENRELIAKYMGYKDEKTFNGLYDDLEGIKGKNRAILNVINALEEVQESGIDEWYFDWFLSKNMRLFIDSNTINMLEDAQLHRFLFTAGEKVKIHTSKPSEFKAFKLCLSQAFGIAIDKHTTYEREQIGNALIGLSPKELMRAFKNGTIESVLQKQIDSYFQSNNIKFKAEVEIESIGHTLKGIKALKAYANRSEGTFETDLKAEFDSKTNGFAIRLLQFPYEEIIDTWGEKVGFFRNNTNNKKDSGNKIYVDYADEHSVLDSYQTGAANLKLPSWEDIELKGAKNKQSYKKVWDILKELLPKMEEDGKVPSELRKLFKNPFMVFMYGAGKKSITENVADKITKSLAREFIKGYENSFKTEREQKIRKLFKGFGFNETQLYNELKTKPFYAIRKGKGRSLEDHLNLLIKNTYGEAVWEVMESQFGKYIRLNTLINTTFRVMAKSFLRAFEAEKAKYSVLTKQVESEIIQKLFPKFPLIQTYLADKNDLNTNLGITSKDRTVDPSLITSSKFMDSNRNITPVIESIKEPAASGGVLWVHALDGSVIFKLLEKFGNSLMTMHDAVLINPLQTIAKNKKSSVPGNFNKLLYKINSEYHILDKLVNQAESSLKEHTDTNFMEFLGITEAKKQDFFMSQLADFMDVGSSPNPTVGQFLEALNAEAESIRSIKEKFFNKNMFIANIDGGPHSQLDTNQYKQYLKNHKDIDPDSSIFYSDPVSGRNQKETDELMGEFAKGTFADPETRVQLLERLEAMGKTLHPAHFKLLKQIVLKIDDKKFKEIGLRLYKSKIAGGTTELNTKDINIFLKQGPTTSMDMNPAEIYVHEVIHAIVSEVINNPVQYKADLEVARLEKLYALASKVVTEEDFIPEPETITDMENAKAQAKERYNYVFNNSDIKTRRGLQEFLTYGLTHHGVIRKLQSTKRFNMKGEIKTIFGHLKDLGLRIIDIFLGTAKFKDWDASLHDSLMNVLYDITKANEKATFSIGSANIAMDKTFEYIAKVFEKGDEKGRKLIEKVTTLLDTTVEAEMNVETPTKWDYTKFLVKALPLLLVSKKYREVIPDTLRMLGLKHTGFIQNVVNEMKDSDNLQNAVEQMGLLVENVDQTAMKQRALTVNSLVEAFGQLDKTEDQVLAEVGLETDLSCLYGSHTVEEIDQIVSSNKELSNQIDKRLKELKGPLSKKVYNWYSKQAEGLGYFLVTGRGRSIQNLNAYSIANGAIWDKKLTPDDRTIRLIDELATLYAIKFMPTEAKQKYVELSQEGKELFYKTHQTYKKESFETVLNKHSYHAIKGYTKYMGDNYVDVKVAPESKEAELMEQHYKKVKVLRVNHTSRHKMAIYTSKLKTTLNYDKGAFSLYSLNRMGTSLMQTLNPENIRDFDPSVAVNAREELERLRLFELAGILHGEYAYTKVEDGYIPVLSTDGKIKDYRIMMHSKLKKELLGYDVSGIRALGNMFSTNIVKNYSRELNKETLTLAQQDQKENYIKGQKKGKNGKLYIKISAKSHDKQIQEYYRLLPEELKARIKLSGKPLAVREDLLLQYFGIRDMSLANLPVIKNFPPQLRQAIKIAEETMRTIVPIYKASIILKTISVPAGNIISNFNLSRMYGTPPHKIFSMYRKNWQYLNEYLKTEKELLDIKYRKRLGTNKPGELKTVNRLEDKLKHSPIAPLMEKGLYQAIVEDLSQSELKSNNRLLKTIDEKTKFVPQFVKTGVKHIYLAEGTPVFDMMAKVTQFSDFVARATEYQVRIEKGVNPDQAMTEALRMIVNYSRPSSSLENYVNQMGLWMFTKFGKRIQWVLTHGLMKKPLSAITALLMQNLLYNTENIGEQQFFLKNWSANWYSPVDIMEGIVLQPHLEYIADKVF